MSNDYDCFLSCSPQHHTKSIFQNPPVFFVIYQAFLATAVFSHDELVVVQGDTAVDIKNLCKRLLV